MSILADELARMAGPKCKEVVSATVQRWEDKIRERIRLEMALKLADEAAWGRQIQRVGVVLSDGLPIALLPHEQELTTKLIEIAGMFRPDLMTFMQGSAGLLQLLDRLGNIDDEWANRARSEVPRIEEIRKLVEELEALSKRATLTEKLKQIDQDVLGAYFPLGKKAKGGGSPVIEIYWTVIGAVAKTIEVEVEGLTIAVLTHELAHAYSHLGADTDRNRWADAAFCQAEVLIKEGIAQYYTDKIMRWLDQRHIAMPYHAYAKLLTIQGLPYHIHEKWAENFSPESVRAAIIECRNSQVSQTDDFVLLMEAAKFRLVRRPKERDLFP